MGSHGDDVVPSATRGRPSPDDPTAHPRHFLASLSSFEARTTPCFSLPLLPRPAPTPGRRHRLLQRARQPLQARAVQCGHREDGQARAGLERGQRLWGVVWVGGLARGVQMTGWPGRRKLDRRLLNLEGGQLVLDR